MLHCRSCGAANSDEDQVCWKCGKILGAVAPQPSEIHVSDRNLVKKIGQSMGKKMQRRQFIIGCILCLGFIVSMFFPRITITAETITQCFIEWQENGMGNFVSGYSHSVQEGMKRMLADEEQTKEKINKALNYRKITISSAQLLFAGKKSIKKIYREMSGKETLDADEEIYIRRLDEMLLWPRIMLFAIYFLPFLLLAIYYLSYRNRWKNIVAIISTWVYFVLAASSNVIWYFVLPSKMAEDYIDSSAKYIENPKDIVELNAAIPYVKELSAESMEILLKAFTGIGIWILIILCVLLLMHSFWLMRSGDDTIVWGGGNVHLRDHGKGYAGYHRPTSESRLYCRFCGSANSNEDKTCCRCGKLLWIEENDVKMNWNFLKRGSGNRQESLETVLVGKGRGDKGIPKWLYLMAGVALFVMVLFFTKNMLLPSAPSESWLGEHIPQNLKAYQYNGKEYVSDVEKLTITEETTADGICHQHCVANLTDDKIQRTLHLYFISQKMDGGKFRLEDCVEETAENFTCSETLGKEVAEAYIQGGRYALGSPSYAFENDNKSITVSYVADASYKNVKISGTAKYTNQLIGNVKIGQYPHSFYWGDGELDTSEVNAEWNMENIEGEWVGECNNGYRLNLKLKEDEDGLSWEGKAFYDKAGGGEGCYTDEGIFMGDELFSQIGNDEEDDENIAGMIDDSPNIVSNPEKSYVYIDFYVQYPQFKLIISPKTLEVETTKNGESERVILTRK